jgi:hypothetical protein
MPPTKPKVANVDGQTCVVATCGARAAKSWWWRLDADGSRSWCCRGDDGAAHRAVLASDGWQLLVAAVRDELGAAPPRARDVVGLRVEAAPQRIELVPP